MSAPGFSAANSATLAEAATLIRNDMPGATGWLNHHRITPHGTPQPELRQHLADVYGLDEFDIGRAVVLWDLLMRGIRWYGGHQTAVNILNGGLKHHRIPEVPEWRKEWLAPLETAEVWKFRSWLTPDGWPAATLAPIMDRYALASYDVNAMFLSAASCDLGTGAPELGTREDAAVLRLPGWVLVEAMDPVPAWLGGRWADQPMWMPTDLVRLLIDRQILPLWSRSLVWPDKRRWLDPHVGLFRDARRRLISIGGQVKGCDAAAAALLGVVKDCYTRAFGGLLRPKDADSNVEHPAVNHGWGAMIPAVAQARMLRAVTKVTPDRLAGIYHDAAWFIAPAGKDAPLEFSSQPGKWKTAGRIPWSDDLAAMYAGGHVKAIARALKGDQDA